MQEPGSGAPVRLDDAASQAPAIRASDRERDAATQRLQEAFAEGRLDDAEFDQRMRTALSARTRPELDGLLADLPQPSPPAGPPATAGRPGSGTPVTSSQRRNRTLLSDPGLSNPGLSNTRLSNPGCPLSSSRTGAASARRGQVPCCTWYLSRHRS